jgi:hypothetical protein
MVIENPDLALGHHRLLQLAFQYWQQNARAPEPQVMALLEGRLTGLEEIRSCSDAEAVVRLALIHGDRERASEFTSYLLKKGYFEPRFVRLCERHDLCVR